MCWGKRAVCPASNQSIARRKFDFANAMSSARLAIEGAIETIENKLDMHRHAPYLGNDSLRSVLTAPDSTICMDLPLNIDHRCPRRARWGRAREGRPTTVTDARALGAGLGSLQTYGLLGHVQANAGAG